MNEKEALDFQKSIVTKAVFPIRLGTVEGFGITKRELFAAIALNGLLSNPGFEPFYRSEQIILDAVDYADKLLKELNK